MKSYDLRFLFQIWCDFSRLFVWLRNIHVTLGKSKKRHYQKYTLGENRARREYGANYEPPKPGELISRQALEIKRAANKAKNRNYWERKARAI